MVYKESDNLNVSLNEEADSNFVNDEVSSKNKSIKYISQHNEKRILRNHYILFFVIENGPTTAYQISKKLKIPYGDIHKTLRDLEYVGLVKSRIILTDKNRAQKQIVVPEQIIEKFEKLKNENT